MLFDLSGDTTLTPKALGAFQKVEFVRMNGADFIHKATLTQTLQHGISRAAHAFNATFKKDEFDHVVQAIENGRAQANFIFLDFENKSVPAGVSITFPSVLPVFNEQTQRFDFLPSLYDEDFIIDETLSDLFRGANAPYRLPNGQSLAFRFIAQQNLHAATNALGEFPAGMGAKAMIVEYGEGCDAAFGLLKKLGAQTDTSDKNYILQIDELDIFKKQKTQSGIQVTPLASYLNDGGVDTIGDQFAITTETSASGFNLALTATHAITSFAGSQPKIRINIASDGRNDKRVAAKYKNNPSADPKFKCLIKSMIMSAGTEIGLRGWLSKGGERIKSADTIPAMNFHLLHEHQIFDAMIGMGAVIRFLGNEDRKYPMKAAVVPFDTIAIPEISEVSTSNDKKFLVIRNGSSNGSYGMSGPATRSASCGVAALRSLQV